MSEHVLVMKDVYKSFGGVKALKGVQLSARKGEIHALIGENGAGKSTFMKILAGAIPMDGGTIAIDGEIKAFRSPKDALDNGISVIYQELNMAPDLSIAENIFLGSQLKRKGIVDWREMNRQSEALMQNLGVRLSPKTIVKRLSVAEQQIVEIAKSLKNRSKILVLDEPSAVLGKKDTELLFDIINRLKRNGVTVIYISHRLDEVLKLTDQVTVLRDGEYIATKPTSSLRMEDLISYMTGKPYGEIWPRHTQENNLNEVALEVRGLSRAPDIHEVSFQVRKGEIVGLAGLVGSGRSEIARLIFGIDRPTSGEILVFGKKMNIRSPRHAMRAGIGFVTEDRKNLGVLLNRPIFENITLTHLKRYAKWIWINNRKEKAAAAELKEKLTIKASDLNKDVKTLSGGNQQKVVIAKWLHIHPKILILDEPTRGVDVGSKSEIYALIQQLKQQGLAIVLISSEFAEIMGMSDRIVVIRRGTAAGEFSREEASKNGSLLEAIAEGGGVVDGTAEDV